MRRQATRRREGVPGEERLDYASMQMESRREPALVLQLVLFGVHYKRPCLLLAAGNGK